MDQPSRAILLTPPGPAAIAVVRLCGPRLAGFLTEHFAKRAVLGRTVHAELIDGGRVIDDPVVVLVDESIADINIHGGPWVVKAVLDLAGRSGFDVSASPGLPLPDEAVDADDPLQREILTHMPMAKTELAVRVLLDQQRAWRRLTSQRRRRIDPRRILRDRSLWWLLHPPRVAIIGPANVGKSTLANQLFAQERSITADVPGTTRDWVGETANIDGLAVTLIDTPGLRDTPDPIERAAIAIGRTEIARADLVVLVLDATRGDDAEQLALRDAHPSAVVVINKIDRARGSTQVAGDLRTIATTGEGVANLRRVIRRRFGCYPMNLGRARWWTQRQREMLERGQLPSF
jgi:small GTP-binding protein